MTDVEVCLACIKTLAVISGRTVNACPTELLPPLEVSMKRKVIRNIKAFVAETQLTNISSSVLGLYNGMKLDNKLKKFVGDCAFMDCVKQDSDVAMEHRVKLWRRIKQKYPNLDLPEFLPDRNINHLMSANINKVRIRSSTNLLALPADSRDELSSVEAFAGCFALPLVVGGDNLVLLINEFEK